MSSILSRSDLLILDGGALVIGLLLIGVAIASLLRSFTPGSQPGGTVGGRRLNRGLAYALGLGLAVFGGAGLLVLLILPARLGLSLLVGAVAGLVAGLVAAFIFVIVPGRRQREDAGLALSADGREARVVIPIPASGLGEVTFQDGTETLHLGARSATGQRIAAGSHVRIERVAQRVAIVRPLDGNGSGG